MGRGARVAITVLVAIAAIAALAIFGFASSGTSKGGRAAPALPSEHLAGAPVTLTSFLHGARGRPALVVFWASWCEPCIHEAPALERFAQSAQGRNRIVGVDWSDERSGASAFVRHWGWTFPTVRDGNGTVGNQYELTTLPTTFVLDSHGRIRRTLHGPQTEATLDQALRAVETA
ncbi:MAG TPA: TlpA disulfide reductase family protein [Solirubrobacteraceae bacterium]|jgi:cytochrome c biogenesis protein CcmG/thiol:disulfide interchange protein DsbE|nr:TlpA disulfide reductase family protein [Solirubrobacteraceae bacterium]